MPAIHHHTVPHYLVTIGYVSLKSLIPITVGVFAGLFGWYIYTTSPSFTSMLFGLPLTLGGGGVFLSGFWNIALAIFSPTYNKGLCPFSKQA